MTTLYYMHEACLRHDTGFGHPECAERLRAVDAALDGPEFGALERRVPPLADIDALGAVHHDDYVQSVLDTIPATGYARLDPDTIVSEGSGEAALRAAGAVIAAVDAVNAGEAKNAFCAVRPPGHHAEPGRAMGFCLFNNVAIGAARARSKPGLQRVAVVDFDVHHGNGTQAAFAAEPELFFGSSHQHPFYPGSGGAGETGCGNIVNAPLPAGAGPTEFRAAWTDRILPALDAFAPQLVLISAGFDAHAADPLAAINVDEEDYRWITAEIAAIAESHAEGRIVSTLEGGYDLDALAASAGAHVAALIAA